MEGAEAEIFKLLLPDQNNGKGAISSQVFYLCY